VGIMILDERSVEYALCCDGSLENEFALGMQALSAFAFHCSGWICS
jgi:hypothetical protein